MLFDKQTLLRFQSFYEATLGDTLDQLDHFN